MHAWPPHFSYSSYTTAYMHVYTYTYDMAQIHSYGLVYTVCGLKSLTCVSSSPPSPPLPSPPLSSTSLFSPYLPSPPLLSPPLTSPPLPFPPLPSPPLPSPSLPSPPHSPAVHYERCRAVIVDWPHVLSDEAMDGDRVLRNTVVRPGCVEEVLHH